MVFAWQRCIGRRPFGHEAVLVIGGSAGARVLANSPRASATTKTAVPPSLIPYETILVGQRGRAAAVSPYLFLAQVEHSCFLSARSQLYCSRPALFCHPQRSAPHREGGAPSGLAIPICAYNCLIYLPTHGAWDDAVLPSLDVTDYPLAPCPPRRGHTWEAGDAAPEYII